VPEAEVVGPRKTDEHIFRASTDEVVSPSNQGFVLGDDANAPLTAAERFDQPHASESSSQRVDLGRSTWRFAAGAGEFFGVKTNGGPAG